MERGQNQEVGEMARIVISLMQEIDNLPNRIIMIGTTNRFENLDKALVRRFTTNYEIMPMTKEDAQIMAKKFLKYAGINDKKSEEYVKKIDCTMPASTITRDCTEFIVSEMMKEE